MENKPVFIFPLGKRKLDKLRNFRRRIYAVQKDGAIFDVTDLTAVRFGVSADRVSASYGAQSGSYPLKVALKKS